MTLIEALRAGPASTRDHAAWKKLADDAADALEEARHMFRLSTKEVGILREWPKHEASMHLTHNQHKAYYLTVQQSIDDDDHGYEEDCWVSPEQKQKAIDTNECWMLQWYPHTPVGFCMLAAADLDVLLAAARDS